MAKRLGNKIKRIIYRYQCTGGCDKKRYTFDYERSKLGICKKCQSLIPPEGVASLFDELNKPKTESEDIGELLDNPPFQQ